MKTNVECIPFHTFSSLVMFCIFAADEFSALFLIEHGTDPNHTTYEHKTSALHLVSTCALSDEEKVNVTSSLLKTSANANLQDSQGWYAIISHVISS